MALSLVLFAFMLIPRLHNLDALVTSDERFWLARSANFYQALDSGDLEYTDQFVHPGVTVMWLGAAAYRFSLPELPQLMGGQLYTRDRSLPNLLTDNGYSKIDVLVQLRRFETIFSALILLAVFFCMSRLVHAWHAFGAVLFVALDPMHIGFTRLLHLDGLSTNSLLLALVAFSWHFERQSRTALIVSGIAAGAAYLTRSANLVLVPLFGMIAYFEILHDPLLRNRSLIHRGLTAVRTLCPWVLVSLITFVACWPAMWVDPGTTLKNLLVGGATLAAEPHSNRIIFLGEVTNDDPGPLYYPVVLLYRISPLTILGLVIVFAAMALRHEVARLLPTRLIRHLLLFSAIYTATLSVAPKKLDRYVLPSVVTLDLAAGLG
ncbi:MAG: glycosyltransferase family 39 protein [Thermomicrobiales bacterium]|nr:glycosyltransferase family 39 protein [Thermomicrobiales bacterium]